MGAKIFISFASQDRGVAMTLCSALESRGFKCWISARDILPGENFQIAIVRAIREAKIMLLVFTANSNNSEEMSKELALASQSKLMVVPLRVEDVTPNDAFAYEFATRQWIDFFADWEFAIQQLADRIENAMRVLPASSEATPALDAPAPDMAVAAPVAAVASDTPKIAAERATWASDEPESAAATAEDAATSEKPRRTGLYLALSLAAVLAAGVGVMASKWMHPNAKPAVESRAMVMLPAAAAPNGIQRASTDATEAPAAVLPDKPAPRRHKAAAAKPAEQDVPY
jgi:hypothetical protein